eukprot:NODE_4269_length_1089_cov_111.688406_g4070_i0.p1 GENE.NODE_4269_length_1089_cov_111.688406_g4070_i0~~NODE_4269_length_1089_cov_111.688406_g4070_i0.p1  ORF type:complete len:309 (+),score=38.90 NODE_4269_length_1089_cov_111.688406_g4070_i0:59-985(+)
MSARAYARMAAQGKAMKILNMKQPVFRPPSEAQSFVLQGTLGCSWNHCTYCLMYRGKQFAVRPLDEVLSDIRVAGQEFEGVFDKVFVGDGDALAMDVDHWLPILEESHRMFPGLRQVSCYATARNLLKKTPQELDILRKAGLKMVYMGPESGDDIVLKNIVKGGTAEDHIQACQKLKAAGIQNSSIFLLGIGGVERSQQHAEASGRLVTAMDPEYVSALTVEVLEGTPLEKQHKREKFILPDVYDLLRELRTIVEVANPTNAVFRTNHASNYLAIGGHLPRDRDRLLAVIDDALDGKIPLRAEEDRGL